MARPHRGSAKEYGRGCRCCGCILAMGAAHGTQGGYANGKCRCDRCSEAQRQYDAKYYQRNADLIRDRERRRYASDPDGILARRKALRAANPEAAREADRRKYAKSREARAKRKRDRRAADPEHVRRIRREWAARTGKGRLYASNRRALEIGAFVEQVDPRVVFERDDYICQGCGIACPTDARWPARNAATLDHIVALVDGGEHSYANTQTLCFICNTSKGGGKTARRSA